MSLSKGKKIFWILWMSAIAIGAILAIVLTK